MELTDIPLSLGKEGDAPLPGDPAASCAATADNIAEAKLKSNSLKRIFKFKKSNLMNLSSSASGGEVHLEGKDTIDLEEQQGSSDPERIVRKYHLRVGGTRRLLSGIGSESGSGISKAESLGDARPSASKTGGGSRFRLQGILSNYWNQVFKKSNTESPSECLDSEIKQIKGQILEKTRASKSYVHVVEISDDASVTPGSTPRPSPST